MRLKRQSEIAIGILASCAASPSAKFPAQKLAQDVGATKDHTYQVVALLVRNGFLHSDRGPGGGIRIARDPADIKLVDVLRLTQPELGGNVEELGSSTSVGQPLLDSIVAAASTFFVRLLDRFTVADLIASRDTAVTSCPENSPLTDMPVEEFLIELARTRLKSDEDNVESSP